MLAGVFCCIFTCFEAGDSSFTLGPHVDGGSTERWEDAEYRKVYRHPATARKWLKEAFSGQPNRPTTNKSRHLQTECYELVKTVYEKLICAVRPLPEH